MSRDGTAPDTDSTATSRRDVLRKAAGVTAGGVAATALAGTGSASQGTIDRVDGVRGRQVDRELATTGRDVLGLLAAEGLLADASPRELPTEQVREIGDVAANREGRASIRGSDDVLRHVTVTHVESGVLTVTVEPERDRAYAFFEPTGADEKYLYDPAAGYDGVAQSDVGTENDCATSCDCLQVLCGDGSRLKECTTCCCHASCGGCCCSTDYDCC